MRAERFTAAAQLHALRLPDGLLGGEATALWIIDAAGEWRHGVIAATGPALLAFPAFACEEGAPFHLAWTRPGEPMPTGLPAGDPTFTLDMPALGVPLPATPARAIFLIEDDAPAPLNRASPAFRVICEYGSYWRDQHGAHLSGWTNCLTLAVRRVELVLGDSAADVTLIPFPDAARGYPEGGDTIPVRWSGYVSGPIGPKLQLRIHTDSGTRTIDAAIPDRLLRLPDPEPAIPPLQQRFIDRVNADQLDVLELGARIVSPGAIDWRREMPGAASYTTLDIHPAPNITLVGDAHHLTRLVRPHSLDAIWSYDVIEHLRLPWLAAAEMNRALRPGGLVFHVAPQTWPMHELPADYWRYSAAALAILFGPEFGFEIIDTAMIEPMVIHHPRRDFPYFEMPIHPGYGHAMILARKIADLPPVTGLEARHSRFVATTGTLYPSPA